MGIFNKSYNDNNEEMLPFFWKLSSIESVGAVTYSSMQSFFESPKALFLATEEKRKNTGVFTKRQLEDIKAASDVDEILREYDCFQNTDVKYICFEDDGFPKKLKDIPDHPTGLFFLGELPKEEMPTVGVIGARECSFYGEEVAGLLGEVLGRYKIPVISGMARGIDSLSQMSAINAGGRSYAVLGGGPDVCYPRESYKLFEKLKENGGIISEYPPKTQPVRIHFVRRNRLISGLSDILCVVEAKKKSGTLITVDCALEQGRDVVAVPGRITDRTSMGCNDLIRQGAEIINDPEKFAEDVLNRFGIKGDAKEKEGTENIEKLSFLEQTLIRNVSEDSFTPEEILEQKDMKQYANSYQILTACMTLSYSGYLVNMGGGRFRLSAAGIKLKNALL